MLILLVLAVACAPTADEVASSSGDQLRSDSACVRNVAPYAVTVDSSGSTAIAPLVDGATVAVTQGLVYLEIGVEGSLHDTYDGYLWIDELELEGSPALWFSDNMREEDGTTCAASKTLRYATIPDAPTVLGDSTERTLIFELNFGDADGVVSSYDVTLQSVDEDGSDR